jgi:hypothetical protein
VTTAWVFGYAWAWLYNRLAVIFSLIHGPDRSGGADARTES